MANNHFEASSTEYRLGYRALVRGSFKNVYKEIEYLQKRSRYLINNDGYAHSALMNTVASWVGTGIRGKWNNKKLQKYWKEFVKNPFPDRIGNFYGFQKLFAASLFADGEVFFRKQIFPKYGKKIPFYLQPIESEYLPLDHLIRGREVIERDSTTGRPLYYNFWKRLPKSKIYSSIKLETVRVPAKDVIHVVDRVYFGQDRGIPRLTSIIIPLLDIQDLMDATLVRQKAAQAIAWVVKRHSRENFNPIGDAIVNDFKEKGEDKKQVIEEIEPGGIHYLEEDEDLIQTTPPDIGNNLVTLLEAALRKSAVGCGLTYEMLTGDLTKVNFSSIRAGILDFRRRVIQLQQSLLIAEGLQPVAEMFRNFCSVWTGQDFSKYEINWYTPKSEGIDPSKDIKADIQALTGEFPLNTHKSIIESYGIDYQDFLDDYKESIDAVRKITREIDSTASDTSQKTGDNLGGNTSDTTNGAKTLQP